MNVVRTPDERFEGLPGWSFAPHYVDVPDGDGGTLRLHAAADAAEEIQFPQHTQPCAVLLHVPLSSPCTGQLVGTAA